LNAKINTFAVPKQIYGTHLFVSMYKEIIKVTARCPIRTTLELVGGKWKLLILFQLAGRQLRLSELKRQIPDISEKMLIQELKNLIDSRLVERKNFGEVPPRVEYQLTAIGNKIMPLILEMRNFAQMYEIESRKQKYKK
jgi:DNA-binding HxlR family transcriptional regulator